MKAITMSVILLISVHGTAFANCYSSTTSPSYNFGSYTAGGDKVFMNSSMYTFYKSAFNECHRGGQFQSQVIRNNNRMTLGKQSQINARIEQCQNAMTNWYENRNGRLCK